MNWKAIAVRILKSAGVSLVFGGAVALFANNADFGITLGFLILYLELRSKD